MVFATFITRYPSWSPLSRETFRRGGIEQVRVAHYQDGEPKSQTFEIRPFTPAIAPLNARRIAALDTLKECDEWIKDILCLDRNRGMYPRTALLIMGIPGLVKRSAFKGKIKALAEQPQARHTEHDDSFREFRQEVTQRIV